MTWPLDACKLVCTSSLTQNPVPANAGEHHLRLAVSFIAGEMILQVQLACCNQHDALGIPSLTSAKQPEWLADGASIPSSLQDCVFQHVRYRAHAQHHKDSVPNEQVSPAYSATLLNVGSN